ncbi:unnamed protein product [Ilex paraguariensis]|uniref:Uncharacterized protein n=1 Tax=Ilex paraguariensis TaxID=185542 RepID=A0ABC8TH03_9AQUA
MKIVRKLEMLIAVLVFVMAACFFGEMAFVKPPAKDVLKGMFVPKLSGNGATGDAIALLGALIMPHNLFLHSALVLSRKIPNSVRGINDACRFFLIESGFALFVALLINISVVSVSGTVCSAQTLSNDNADRCNNLNLNSASFLLKNVLGKSSSKVYAIALLASGQSSTITGTYAGQYIMQGFLDIKMRKWMRNLMTRLIAISPSLVVSIIGGSSGAGRLIIIASMILSFELPFALIPLLKFSSSATKMGPHKNSIYIIVISWLLGLGIIGINIYYLSTGFVGWLIHNSLPKIGNVFIGILVFPLMAVYVLTVIYLMFRKDTVVTFGRIWLTSHCRNRGKGSPGKWFNYAVAGTGGEKRHSNGDSPGQALLWRGVPALIIVISWLLGLGIIGINIYYLSTGFVGWLIHNSLPKIGNVFIGILVFPLMAVYVLTVIYLMFRKDTVVTFGKPTKNDMAQIRMEHGQGDADSVPELEPVPYREDLADIPLPE